ncbi:MAG: DUF6350 family protein [Bowdeniella nasicola]|nr:DUF6350 family protein [Bowdeniella nasicola]
MSTYTSVPPRALPTGWLRASLAGVEAVVLTWLATAAVALFAYAVTASNPQLGGATWTDAVSVATHTYFLAFFRPVATGLGSVSLAPTLLTVLVVVLAAGAARRLEATGIRHVLFTMAGAFLASMLIAMIAGAGLRLTGAAALSAIAAGLGASSALGAPARALDSPEWRGSIVGRVRAALQRIPDWARAAVAQARALGWAWLALSGLALVGAVAAAWHRVMQVQGAITEGTSDVLGLWLAQIGYLPNTLVWAFGYLSGAGYTIGPVRFAPGVDATGLLPAVPILAGGPHSAWSPWIVCAPIVVSAALGVWHTRRTPEPSVVRTLVKATVVGGVAVAGASLAALVTSGAVGAGAFAHTGVSPLAMAGMTALTGALPYVLGAVGAHRDTLAFAGAQSRRAAGEVKTRTGELKTRAHELTTRAGEQRAAHRAAREESATTWPETTETEPHSPRE